MTARLTVVGPPRSGVTTVVEVLRSRGHEVVDAPAPIVVVTCSAVAPITQSDCAAIDAAARHATAVVGAVTKVDAHRGWRDVLAANRATLAAYSARYRDVPWVGIAAAPDVGEPDVGAVIAALCEPRPVPSGVVARAPDRRLRAATLRDELQRERMRLGRHHRMLCAELRSEFRERAARVTRAGTADFGAEFLRAAETVVDDLRDRIDAGLDDVAARVGVARPEVARVSPGLPPAPSFAGSAESRVTAALGAGFGLGVAMTIGRVLTEVAPVPVAFVVGGLLGCALTAWLVTTRALVHRRALLERWVTESVTAVRWQAEEMVADALLEAQSGFGAGLDGSAPAPSPLRAPHFCRSESFL